MVASVKSASGLTSGGRIPRGKIKDCIAELYYLSLIEAPVRRLVLTTPGFFNIFMKKTAGAVDRGHHDRLPSPPRQTSRQQVDEVVREASREVTPTAASAAIASGGRDGARWRLSYGGFVGSRPRNEVVAGATPLFRRRGRGCLTPARLGVRLGSSVYEHVFDARKRRSGDRREPAAAACALRHQGGRREPRLERDRAAEPVRPGVEDLWAGSVAEKSQAARKTARVLRRGVRDAEGLFERVETELKAAGQVGARLVTVLDDGYPPNLRLIPNLPPFIFYRGALTDEDAFSVAVVGTRNATDQGIRRAADGQAARRTRCHRHLRPGPGHRYHCPSGALAAGGRTIAVLGTGITRCYPAENRDLAEEITRSGALVSQFWPTRPPGKDTFPRRNVVTSGLSQGTVVIEATKTSGAKMQARLALEHGKKVFLVKSLVTDQQWAKSTWRTGAPSRWPRWTK